MRYIANRSSGKQGHAIAAAGAAAGAEVMLVSGPVTVPDPIGVTSSRWRRRAQMLEAVEQAMPADCAVFAAAVADWRVGDAQREKIKKTKGGMPALSLVENPDILATVAHRKRKRPRLVIGFAAETENIAAPTPRTSSSARAATGSSPTTCRTESGVMGGDINTVHLVTASGVESWPPQSKDDVARALIGAHRGCACRGIVMNGVEIRCSACRTATDCRCRLIKARSRRGSISSPRSPPMRRS